jgi:tetratricopeptide (TPR) repeat protein
VVLFYSIALMKKINIFGQIYRRNKLHIVIYLAAAILLIDTAPNQAQSLRDALYFYNEGRNAMLQEDWYTAIEDLLECLRQNPAHAEGAAALAECYYTLGEYDQALVWVRKARSLARTNMEIANLEAFILIANGHLDEAAEIVKYVQSREPYNRNALFTAAELDVARGKSGDAVQLFREAVRRYPDDRRLLISLALVLGSLGDTEAAREYIERAEIKHPDDYRVYYYAAYLASRAGRINTAIQDAEKSLSLRPGFTPAVSLLASLRYRNGEYEAAAALADRIIAADHDDTGAWLLKGMAYSSMGRKNDARITLETALGFDSEDEFIRIALEEFVIETSRLEDPQRERWATYHFDRARSYRGRNLNDEAIFEYRRGLRLNPYAKERLDYAETLRLLGYPELYLEELIFMRDLGMSSRAVDDQIETYTALMNNNLVRQWDVKPEELQAHWNIAVFSIASQAAFYHTDAGYITSQYIKDILIHDGNISTPDLEVRQQTFSSAFRSAREGTSGGPRANTANSPAPDYFLIVNVLENERDLAVNAELYVARTGARAGAFSVYRAGVDRLRNAARNIAEQLGKAMPFRAVLLRRAAGEGLIDKGRLDGSSENTVYQIVKKGSIDVQSEGIGLQYAESDVTGSFTSKQVGEELTSGAINRAGFFDLVTVGDEVVAKDEQSAAANGAAPAQAADPELRAILRTLR